MQLSSICYQLEAHCRLYICFTNSNHLHAKRLLLRLLSRPPHLHFVGANPQPNEPQPDPMDTDMDGLAAQAGANSPGKLKERMFSTPTLEDVDVQILATPVPDKDLAIDQMRAHTQRRVADLIQNNPLLQQKQGDIMSFAAAQHREAVLDELNMRGARLNAKVKKQVRKIIEGKPAAADSPNKIKDAAQSLFTAQKNTSAATASMDSILRSALEQLSSSDPEKSALEMLNDLLMSHKQAKRTRATKQCFIQHISSARNHLMNGIAAARAQGDHKLAFELLVAFRHLESQIKRFCDLTDKVGFEAARDHFTNRGNPLNGMTDQMWEVITAMAGNDEHAAIFAKLINGKHIALPEVPANTTADSSGDEEAGGARKRRKGGSAASQPRPHCMYCGQDTHYQATCRKWLADRQLGSRGPSGGDYKHKGFVKHRQQQANKSPNRS